jgi:hypothetical protein
MEATWLPGTFIETVIPAPSGIHPYRLSIWGKQAGLIRGSAWLSVKRSDTLNIRKSIVVIDTTWTLYSFRDTLTTGMGDSLVVRLTGGASELGSGETFFDLCELEELE